MMMLQEIINRVSDNDPARGQWPVSNVKVGKIWCDASSIATGVCVQIDGEVVEDACWLRKENDVAHINLAELDAVLKGVNMALKWNLSQIEIITDSATVYSWVNSVLTLDRRVKTHGLGEALVRRRLTLLADLINECDLTVSVEKVASESNLSDSLTRVPKRWIASKSAAAPAIEFVSEKANEIRKIHQWHHFGKRRTLYVVQRVRPDLRVSEAEVQAVVETCASCRSVDPAPVRWEKGKLDVRDNWRRMACDVTHYEGKTYMTWVDCGPSRLAIWRRIPSETEENIVQTMVSIFRERGPPEEILMDNSRSFRSSGVALICDKWRVKRVYRCAYRPAGNGIVERNHRTIKRMAARTGQDPLDMVFWYNFCPRTGLDGDTAPSARCFTYEWRCPGQESMESMQVEDPILTPEKHHLPSPGDEVFVKPPNARCTTKWNTGVVTGIGEHGTVEVDNVPRHISHVRAVPQTLADESPFLVNQGQERNQDEGRLRRQRNLPAWLNDYVI
jgi:ribonuclease HI/transposase InsO family protein